MADFIRSNAITFAVPSASPWVLRLNDDPQPQKGRHRDTRPVFHDHPLAMGLIEHPDWNQDPQILLTLRDDRRIETRTESANHLNFVAEERMEPVSDPRRAELMSSVLMRCATASPRTC